MYSGCTCTSEGGEKNFRCNLRGKFVGASPDRARINFVGHSLLGGDSWRVRVLYFVVLACVLAATTKKVVVKFFEEESASPEKILATPLCHSNDDDDDNDFITTFYVHLN